MAVASWVGGSGDFTDPDEWSNGKSPAPPPGTGDLALYGTAGTVQFSGNTNVEADIAAAMTFDVSAGGYDLINTTEGLGGLQLKQGGALTITGPGEVDASVIAAGTALVTVTGMAVLNILADASNSAAQFSNSATLAVLAGGMFETQGSIALDMQALYPTAAPVLIVDQGTVDTYALLASQATLSMQGGVVALSAASGLRVSPSSFTTGVYDLEAGSTLAAGSAGLTLGQSTGTVAGSTLAVAGDLEVQDGRLSVGASGTVTGRQVGLSAGNTPSLVVGVTAGVLSASGALDISAAGTSSVSVGVGANGILSAGSMAIDGGGTVTVTVTGGTLATTGSLTIAETGTAALVIGSGGTGMVGGTLIIGHQAASQGTDSVTGAGAAMIVHGAGTIGAAGSGTLVIANGARGTFATGVTLGLASGAGASGSGTGDGHLFVSAATLAAAGDEIFGDGGQGTLSILAQGLDSAAGNVIFGAAGGSAFGQLAAGTLGFGGTLAVGGSGAGTLVVQAAGSVLGAGPAAQVAIGAQAGAAGTLSVLGGTLAAGALAVAGSAAAAGGSGTLVVTANGQALIAGDAQVWTGGMVQLFGGTISAGDLRIAANAMLYGNGTVIGPAGIDGSVVVGGNTDLQPKPGPLIFLNDVSGSGTLEIPFDDTLVLNAAVAAGDTIRFDGPGGALDLGAPAAMLGTLANFAAGDQIDLVGIAATQAVLVGSVIEITNDGALVADIATSDLTGVPGFDVASDNNGGTLITISNAATGPAGTPSYPGAPLITTVPAGITAMAGAATPVTGISISDSSAGAGVTVTALIEARSGLLTADAAAGGQVTVFSGGMAVQISGALDQVNADLATLAYQGAAPGSDTLTVDSADSVGDSDGHLIPVTIDPPCFCAGTRIMTAQGPIAVERLAIGDRVVTAAGGERPVVWLGHRRIETGRHPDPDRIRPVRVAAGAFGPGQPCRDLFLSPDHAVFAGGVLIPVKHLIGGGGIAQVARRSVEYWHVELDRHDILLAEGLPVESYLDTGNRAAFANGGAAVRLHPDFSPQGWDDACAELVQAGPPVIALRQQLFARAGGGRARPAPGLRVLAGRRELPPVLLAACVLAYRIPAGRRAMRLLSPAWVPCVYDAASLDRRRLGVRLFAAVVDGMPIDLADPILASGFHPVEETAEGSCRWTTGDARLVLPEGAAVLVLRLGDARLSGGARRTASTRRPG